MFAAFLIYGAQQGSFPSEVSGWSGGVLASRYNRILRFMELPTEALGSSIRICPPVSAMSR